MQGKMDNLKMWLSGMRHKCQLAIAWILLPSNFRFEFWFFICLLWFGSLYFPTNTVWPSLRRVLTAFPSTWEPGVYGFLFIIVFLRILSLGFEFHLVPVFCFWVLTVFPWIPVFEFENFLVLVFWFLLFFTHSLLNALPNRLHIGRKFEIDNAAAIQQNECGAA